MGNCSPDGIEFHWKIHFEMTGKKKGANWWKNDGNFLVERFALLFNKLFWNVLQLFAIMN